MSHVGVSAVENSAVNSEIMCLTEEPPSAAVPAPATGTIPTVERFVPGSPVRAMYDNVAFQPHTGNLVILEDGPNSRVLPNGTSQLRGNDLWICLSDGDDDDTQTDGYSLRRCATRHRSRQDSSSSRRAKRLVNLQHRDVDAANHRGSLMMISGFKVKDKDKDKDNTMLRNRRAPLAVAGGARRRR
jgi:hypothetical protein